MLIIDYDMYKNLLKMWCSSDIDDRNLGKGIIENYTEIKLVYKESYKIFRTSTLDYSYTGVISKMSYWFGCQVGKEIKRNGIHSINL